MAVILGASADAKAFGIGADFGYSRILIEDGDDFSGFGGDLYLRPLPLPIVDPEIQLGLHHFGQDSGGVETSSTIWPVMAGARVNLPIIPIFVAGHVGLLGNHFSADNKILQTNVFSDTNWDFGFNIGGGFEFLDLTVVKLGISALYYVVPKNHDNTPDFNMFTVGLDGSLGF
ncbi:MAG: outer membrane beta-barrel protein [Clostridia bacterium]|nr:outer membrane beta-barrel protein [Deltaproteobacteria bacterium]